MKEWREVLFAVAAVLAFSVAAWFLPDRLIWMLTWILGVGVCFDLFSVFCYLMTFLTGKYHSGLPIVGLVCYASFLLAYRKSLLAPEESALSVILLNKVLEGLLLTGFHVLCQLPGFFQRRTGNHEDTNPPLGG
jgi:hypothetical protein